MNRSRLARWFRTERRATEPDLETRISCFREVLHANNAALGYLATIQETLGDDSPLSPARVHRLVAGITTQTYRMIVNLNRMTRGRFPEIVSRFEQIKRVLAQRIEIPAQAGAIDYVVPLGRLRAESAEVVGQKSALLGEARRLLAGHVPDGFGTSIEAYHAFMNADGLRARVAAALEGSLDGDLNALFEASARATQMIQAARVPPEVRASIEEAVRAVSADPATRFAVRSSALMEGGVEMSFAGQYRSMLNVPPDGVVDAFKQVVASKYSPEALAYRLARGFEDAEVAMCCCVIEMVDARAAGVSYSACSSGADCCSLVHAVHGLGHSAVDGSAEPDTYWVDCRSGTIVEQHVGHQDFQILCAAPEGTLRTAVSQEAIGRPVLDAPVAARIASLATTLGTAVQTPVEVEWAVDPQGRIFVIQMRSQPVRLERPAEVVARRVSGYPVLLAAGSPVSPGIGAGPVHKVKSDLDLLTCPNGAVLVTHEASPRLAVLLPRVAAVVADMGEATGHLATVAREMRLPALFATRTALQTLRNGDVVTVDAEAAVIYRGRVDPLLATPDSHAAPAMRALDRSRELLAAVAGLITPLTLRERLASGCSPRGCRTLHDIIRFCHQATIESMFDLGDRVLKRGEHLRRLVTDVPIDCRLFDLGGGLKAGVPGTDVRIDDVASRPMQALWAGMTDHRLRWNNNHGVSLAGLVSAMVNYNFDQDARARQMGEPSYAFISGDYLNLNSRIGFHFSTVDARIGDVVESNYISFRFVGGSTGITQRSRRATLLHRLLAAHGFETDCRADLINARLRHRPAGEMEEALQLVGLMMGYVNHLDMALVSDDVMLDYERAFQAGDYGFCGANDDA